MRGRDAVIGQRCGQSERPIHSPDDRPAGGETVGRNESLASYRVLPSFFFVFFFAFFFSFGCCPFCCEFFSFLFFFLLIFFATLGRVSLNFDRFVELFFLKKKTNLLPIVDPGKATFTFTGFLLGFTGFC